jgi:hypothetical protein
VSNQMFPKRAEPKHDRENLFPTGRAQRERGPRRCGGCAEILPLWPK